MSLIMESSNYLQNYIIKRYTNSDEKTWDDIVERVSKLYPTIKTYMLNMMFIPGGRNLATINTDHVLIPNCVVVDIEDDLTNIFTTLTRLVELTRRGAGIGMNFGKLRPANSHAKHFDAFSCGPIGFLNMYSVVLKTIQQMARHGAFIGILPITHPDVLSFINVKQDLTKINNFNLSILVDDEFINNVRNHPNEQAHADFTIKHNDGTTEHITTYNHITYDNNFVVKDVSPLTITYKELFNEIVRCMWRTGEPGLLFKENINKTNILKPILGDIVACNPCVVGKTNILTEEYGNVPINEHVGEILKVWNGEEYTPSEIKETGHDQIVYKVILSDYRTITTTGNHKFVLQNGDKKELLDIDINKENLFNPEPPVFNGVKTMCYPYLRGYNEYDKFVPTSDYTLNDKLEWFAGVIDRIKNKHDSEQIIRIVSTNKRFLKDVQHLLFSLGCLAVLSTQNYHKWSLFINQYYVYKLIGMGLTTRKTQFVFTRPPFRIKSKLKIRKIIKQNDLAEKVYCITTLNDSHRGCFNNIITGNCGEISMYPNECCNLGSVNLSVFTNEIDYNPLAKLYDETKSEDIINKTPSDDKITEDTYNPLFDVNYFVNQHVNIYKLKQCVKHAVVFLDKVIDEINTEDKQIDEFVRKTRRIGLGVMGVHDMLIKLRIPYDRPEARQIVKLVLGTIKDEVYNTSRQLVSSRGSVGERFEVDKNETLSDNNEVINNVANVALMTIAPNGSTSMIPNVSSGIEPYFSLGYYRMVDNSTKQTGLIINKQLEKWINNHVKESIRDEITKQIITEGIETVDNKIVPDFIKNVFKTAQDISPRNHILMLAAAQSQVDNAISKTINLPENATKQEIADCIILAHKLGVKGMTVYRDNCRQNVIMSSKQKSLSHDSCESGLCDL